MAYRPSNRPSKLLALRLINSLIGEASMPQLMEKLELNHRPNFRENYLVPAIDLDFIEMTNPESPKSPKQKYRLTEKGKALYKKQFT
ncbi:Fic family protein [Confluentibacter flavum]|uniref:Filamentation induced by cAMP protein Fic-like C-terminal domain-containing protein n=1 Tax=Confluentibacter flavum TaxID=1909700 RepID=A0A2N3HMH8_9FLAO|nr:hypothetical protein [Confluentibacter flavum]PKQ46163.1 hypothetical protein CSW08_03060 [Confluentibacter flavum]